MLQRQVPRQSTHPGDLPPPARTRPSISKPTCPTSRTVLFTLPPTTQPPQTHPVGPTLDPTHHSVLPPIPQHPPLLAVSQDQTQVEEDPHIILMPTLISLWACTPINSAHQDPSNPNHIPPITSRKMSSSLTEDILHHPPRHS